MELVELLNNLWYILSYILAIVLTAFVVIGLGVLLYRIIKELL